MYSKKLVETYVTAHVAIELVPVEALVNFAATRLGPGTEPLAIFSTRVEEGPVGVVVISLQLGYPQNLVLALLVDLHDVLGQALDRVTLAVLNLEQKRGIVRSFRFTVVLGLYLLMISLFCVLLKGHNTQHSGHMGQTISN